ncbi:Por secretion system C-terminal sorting domain-containing protein [Reichenbachiella agariperforans]|uniref:Por secretion system C-terminal sorting domain-containing protein n=1 Tax=Reichenbachiella agariperforans TaxID=156994 RepID=A0A1M6UVJ1_REIAG|nr:T9SS type A sorting domain-containing protein [Reichenbachiella agariperforans]SHK73066.1 Por secretion system C-terminal sorting domain-containing protein [Reichenbachiella agariperforans]
MKVTKINCFILLGMMLSSIVIYAQCPTINQINEGDGAPEYTYIVTGDDCDVENGGNTITQGYNDGVESLLTIASDASLTINEDFEVYDSVKVYGTLIVNGDMTVASRDGASGVLYVAPGGSVTVNGDYTNGGEDAVLIIIPLDEGDPGNTNVEGEMTVNGTYTNNDGGTTTVADGGTMQTDSWDQEGGDVYVSGGDGVDCATGCCGSGCAALPVTLVGFSVDQDGGDAILRWSTAQELNNDYFIIQKKRIDEESFRDLARVVGAGTVNHQMEYEYVDFDFEQDSYYRLVQVDYDGQSKKFRTLYLSNDLAHKGAKMLIYPNPSSGAFHLKGETSLSMRVIDMSGTIIYEDPHVSTTHAETNLNHAIADRSGSFFVTFYDQNDAYTQTIIKH